MGATTEIAWTHATFNPWWGCQRVSPGCEHCYAETFSKRVGFKVWGPESDHRFFGEPHWEEPRKWNRDAELSGERRRVFCASMADVFEDRRDLDPWREKLFALIEETPWLDWQLLTKRPENMVQLAPARWATGWPRNVWAGCTVEDQKRAEQRVPLLLRVPAAIRFLSCEPLLEHVSVSDVVTPDGLLKPLVGLIWQATPRHFATKGVTVLRPKGPTIHWVIVGGESGAGARPFDLGWARSIVAQCAAAEVACFVKQLGADAIDGTAGCSVILRDRKGADWAEWPAELRVRQFPNTPPSHSSEKGPK